MANYTITLYDLLEQLSPTHDVHVLFPATYQLYDVNYKNELEGKIFAHFSLREIGAESPDRFLTFFRTVFLETLPKANKLYELFAHDFMPNVFKNDSGTISRIIHEAQDINRDMDTTSSRTTRNQSSSQGQTSAETHNKTEDTPYTNYPANTNYTSGRTAGTSTGSSSGSGSSSGTEDVTQGVTDKTDNVRDKTETETFNRLTGAEADAARKYMDIIMNVDTLFYDALEDCFMQVF